MTERLLALLRRELGVVAGYQETLRALKQQHGADCGQILRLAADHQRTVTALHGSIQSHGGAPVAAAEPWDGSSKAAFGFDGTPAMLGKREFVGALLDVERSGLEVYVAALTWLEEDARELVELELIPRQRRNIAGLSALLVTLPV